MAEPALPNPLREVVAALVRWLAAAEVRGVVIGGVAASLLGRPRATRDVDALILVEEQRWESFLAAGDRFGFAARRPDALVFAHRTRVILARHLPTGIEVDLVCAGLPFEEQVIARGIQMDVGGVLVPVPAPEDLIVMKAVAGRPRDRLDVESVLDVHPELDLAYIRRWVGEFARALDKPAIVTDLEALVQRRRGPFSP